jgi:hypothetical protein
VVESDQGRQYPGAGLERDSEFPFAGNPAKNTELRGSLATEQNLQVKLKG